MQSQVAEKGRKLMELQDTLTLLVKEKEKLEEVHSLPFINCFHSKTEPSLPFPAVWVLPIWSRFNMSL